MAASHLRLYSSDLVSKWGFEDGQPPEAWLDWCEKNGYQDTGARFPWAALVRTFLVPVPDQDVTVIELETHHNPIRADAVDGVDVRDAWFNRASEPVLTPECVDIRMTEVLRIVRENPTP